jgi:hypothetical protein
MFTILVTTITPRREARLSQGIHTYIHMYTDSYERESIRNRDHIFLSRIQNTDTTYVFVHGTYMYRYIFALHYTFQTRPDQRSICRCRSGERRKCVLYRVDVKRKGGTEEHSFSGTPRQETNLELQYFNQCEGK